MYLRQVMLCKILVTLLNNLLELLASYYFTINFPIPTHLPHTRKSDLQFDYPSHYSLLIFNLLISSYNHLSHLSFGQEKSQSFLASLLLSWNQVTDYPPFKSIDVDIPPFFNCKFELISLLIYYNF